MHKQSQSYPCEIIRRKEREKDGGMRNDRVDAKREQRHRKVSHCVLLISNSIGCSFMGHYLTQWQSKAEQFLFIKVS